MGPTGDMPRLAHAGMAVGHAMHSCTWLQRDRMKHPVKCLSLARRKQRASRKLQRIQGPPLTGACFPLSRHLCLQCCSFLSLFTAAHTCVSPQGSNMEGTRNRSEAA